MRLALAALARSSLATNASYSGSLLVVGKSSRIMHSILSPLGFGLLRRPFRLVYLKILLYKYSTVFFSSAPWPSPRVNSVMKSATTCPFTAVRGQYCMSNSLSSTAYKAILPAASGLLIAFLKSLSIKMTMVCAWKYDLSFRAAINNAKANFSIWGYLSSAPQSTGLVK